MDNELIELCSKIKEEISNENTFHLGIENLLLLRKRLFNAILQLKAELCRDDFNAMPFIGEDGFHSKTIAYSIWHIFRIEDIVSHALINGDDQIFFSDNFQERIRSPIITTGNELVKQRIGDFSEKLDLETLYQYSTNVKANTELMLKNLVFADLKRRFTIEDKLRLESLCVVSQSDNAKWLIDYWCGEDLKGLILMPFSEHWMAHIHACMLIRNKLETNCIQNEKVTVYNYIFVFYIACFRWWEQGDRECFARVYQRERCPDRCRGHYQWQRHRICQRQSGFPYDERSQISAGSDGSALDKY